MCAPKMSSKSMPLCRYMSVNQGSDPERYRPVPISTNIVLRNGEMLFRQGHRGHRMQYPHDRMSQTRTLRPSIYSPSTEAEPLNSENVTTPYEHRCQLNYFQYPAVDCGTCNTRSRMGTGPRALPPTDREATAHRLLNPWLGPVRALTTL